MTITTNVSFSDFITDQRAAAKPPTADIRSRWASRIVPRALHQQGRAGAETYLRDYGKGISTAKVIALAIMAEHQHCPDLALGFWAKAYELAIGSEPDLGSTLPTSATDGIPSAPEPATTITVARSGFPAHLQPKQINTMQPVDAQHDRQHYIDNAAYIGQPKRDGNRMVVIATPDRVWYQSRSTNLINSPSHALDLALQAVAQQHGSFVLDGEKVFLDVAGGEHRTGAQAALTNHELGQPQVQVRCVVSVFKALYANGTDLTTGGEVARMTAGQTLVQHIAAALGQHADPGLGIELVPTAWNRSQKKALCERQRAEGREGEVWIRAETAYLAGKVGGEALVRTKYLEETEVVITGLTPTTVAVRPFGAIEVADLAGRPLGKVGSGFDASDARQIATLVARHPEGIRIVVRHQGRTETGMLWHARFLRVVGPVGMAA